MCKDIKIWHIHYFFFLIFVKLLADVAYTQLLRDRAYIFTIRCIAGGLRKLNFGEAADRRGRHSLLPLARYAREWTLKFEARARTHAAHAMRAHAHLALVRTVATAPKVTIRASFFSPESPRPSRSVAVSRRRNDRTWPMRKDGAPDGKIAKKRSIRVEPPRGARRTRCSSGGSGSKRVILAQSRTSQAVMSSVTSDYSSIEDKLVYPRCVSP